MKRILCLLALVCSITAFSASAAESKSGIGWISDSMCGAKHSGTTPDAECVKKCISGGEKPVFVDAKNKVWAIENPDSVKDFYGEKVNVSITANNSAKSVHVDMVMAAH